MFKKIMTKKIVLITAICVAVLLGSVGVVGAYNLSKSEKRVMYDNLKQDFDNKINTLYSKEGEERTKLAEELKKKGLEIKELGNEVKTQEEFAEELKVALASTKEGLADTKAGDDAKTNDKTKLFIKKMEKKIERIEKDFTNGTKTPEQLLKELRDRTDVDN